MTTNESSARVATAGSDIPTLVRWSATLGKFAETIGKWATLFMLPLVFVTIWDVGQRKIVKFIGDIMLEQGWLEPRDWMYSVMIHWLPFRSTLLQELEWHFHTALFTLVLGYGYIYNRHVRVDLIREKLQFRKQAWIELIGCTFFMIPYCLVVAWFAVGYAHEAFLTNEQSSSQIGLSHRWAIKSVLVFGLVVAAFAGIAVWLQTVFALFNSQSFRFPLYTIEREDEKLEKRMLLENIDDSFSDGSNEAKRGDTTKLMSRQISEDAFDHAGDTRSQKLFYYLGLVVMICVLILIFHTFDFWSWLI